MYFLDVQMLYLLYLYRLPLIFSDKIQILGKR